MFTVTALIIATGGMAVLAGVIAYLDLRDMRIPNWSVLAVLGLFAAAALPVLPWGLSWEVFLWRLGYAVGVFVLGFLLYSVAGGRVGAGDLKLLAALAPFLSADNLLGYALLYLLVSVLGLVLYLAARMIANGRETGFKGIDRRGYFPAGVLLGLAMAALLVLELSDRLAAV